MDRLGAGSSPASEAMSSTNPMYALGQLARALFQVDLHVSASVRERARARVERWERVIGGMFDGTLTIGSRTPTSAPAWATLEVVHGGFATGALAAGGPLLPFEEALGPNRQSIALHFLSDEGRAQLREQLASGLYRVDVPEEGALLAVVALADRGENERAAAILDAVTPFFDRLRFYPKPATRPVRAVTTVHVATIGETRKTLAEIETPLEIRRMHESLTVWAPLLDRLVDFFQAGARTGARELLTEYRATRKAHSLCKHHRKDNLAILVRALETLDAGRELTARERGLVGVAVRGHLGKHGATGSARRVELRARQARVASLPSRGESARVLVARLRDYPADAALDSLDEVGRPEAGRPLFPSVIEKLERCLEASVEELVERGVIPSGDVLAEVLPQMSAHVRALGFPDPAIAALYASIDAAFRRRRSLLLLDYQHQVRLAELPWADALEALRRDDETSKAPARRLFEQVSALAIESFPMAIVPNPLLTELRMLAERAKLDLPFVEELAADIFMGGFTGKFVRAAQLAARRLEGTLYARYYELPSAQLLAMDLPAKGPAPAFGALCERRAPSSTSGSVARNGTVIEQQQILTTQNLLPLLDAARLSTPVLSELARRTFHWLVARVQIPNESPFVRLRNVKNAAYAFRQMALYLSLGPDVDAFLVEAREHLGAQPEAFVARFTPFLDGLEDAHHGRTPRQRLLGWSLGPHPLLSP